ncbi:GspE/PulE family protein [Patescibacteria group bacterium]|nr:GspE/PulE family protein [Patescibacteria group bacterium]MBU1563671.1 GspE/PulE family protein [Patescibacteria group bacterium]
MTLIDPTSKQLQDTLSELKHKEEEDQAKELAEKLELPYINLVIAPISPNDLLILDKEKAQKGNLLVMKKVGKILHLAVKDPNNPQTQEVIKEFQEQGFECKFFIVSSTSLENGWAKYKLALTPQKDAPIWGVFDIKKEDSDKIKDSLKTVQDIQKEIKNLSTSQLLSLILIGSIKMEASDVHLEPEKDKIRIRYRIDGLLQDIAEFPVKEYHFLVSRIKTLSDMIINITDISQDGRFTAKFNGKTVDLRVSVLPSNYGESIVMRLLSISTIKLNLDELGIRPELFETIKSQINRPNGMILVTGPTGSGKTTTLYSCINYINKPGNKIITVEDPVEYRLKGITQTPISHRKGQTFAKSLKSIVRQDPDVLMLGEIRDQESAEIAIEFALTGHIVFSTIHTNEAAGAIPRLFGMKISPDSLASSLNLIIAQRLVRKLCPDCKEKYKASPEIVEAMKKILSSISRKSGLKIPEKIPQLYKAKGCEKCHGLGYKGRLGVFELLTVDDEIKKIILTKIASFEIQDKAQKQGMITLIQDAVLRVIEGITSLDEVERIVGSIKLAEK